MAEDESREAQKQKPPNRGEGWYDRLFDLLASRSIDLVDLDFIKVNIVSDPSNARRFKGGLLFLGLIKDDGTPTDIFQKLKLKGDEFSQNLKKVLETAYAPVFQKVHLENVVRNNLVNFFIEKYELSGSAANGAVDVFVHLASKANIPLSDELKTETSTAQQRPHQVVSTRRSEFAPSRKEKTPTPENPPGTVLLQLGNVKIILPENDKAAAETAKELLDLHIKRNFPSSG
jgi:hypothetical protein